MVRKVIIGRGRHVLIISQDLTASRKEGGGCGGRGQPVGQSGHGIASQ